jgi:hypothetical protein
MRNHALERSAQDFILLDSRFQRPNRALKKAILERLGFAGEFTAASFDLVMTAKPCPPISVASLPECLRDITLIEMKTTAKPIQNTGLAGFFFGSSETQYSLASVAGDRLMWAFVVMNSENDYGRPFFALLSTEEVHEATRSRRIQFQVNFKTSDMPRNGELRNPLPHPDYLREL